MVRRLYVALLPLVWAAIALVDPAYAEVLTIAGTGSSAPLIHLLFEEFQKQAPAVKLHLVTPPLGSNGALKALSQGRIDIAVIGRPIPQEELRSLGQYIGLADTPFVVASRDGQRVKGFTLGELAQVHEGSIQKWDDGSPMRLVLRGSFESDTLLLKDMSPELNRALGIAARRPGMAGAVNDLETVTLIAKTHGSLGPTTLGLLTTMRVHLKVFPLNGVMPSIENLRDGRYPWRKSLGVVLPRNPSNAALNFVGFLRSPTAQDIMKNNDYLPVAP